MTMPVIFPFSKPSSMSRAEVSVSSIDRCKVRALCSDSKVVCIYKAARAWVNRLVVCVNVE